jgi:hypothetical protein
MRRPTTQHPLANDRGSAIVMVLCVLLLLMIIGIVFMFSARTERLVASAQADGARASLIAQSGIERSLGIIASACNLYAADAQGRVIINPLSFSPHLTGLFQDENGLFNGGIKTVEFQPDLTLPNPQYLHLTIINQTGKLDPNFNGRPSKVTLQATGLDPWPLATLGRTPLDIDFKYMDTDLKEFGGNPANTLLDGALFTGNQDQRWFSRDQILKTAKKLALNQQLTSVDLVTFDQKWKNQDELFPFSATSRQRDPVEGDANANTFRDRDTKVCDFNGEVFTDLTLSHCPTHPDQELRLVRGQLYNRVSVEELRKRICKIKFGSPIFLSPAIAQSVFDYWFNPDPANGRDKSYLQMHQDRIVQLTEELMFLQADKAAKMAQFQTEWDARAPIRSETDQLNSQNYNLNNRNELLNEYLNDPMWSAAQIAAFQQEIAANNQKIASNQQRINNLKAQLDQLNAILQPLDQVIDEINAHNRMIAHDNYIIGILNAWQADGIPTLANFHKQVMAALKNPTTGEDDLPWLTRLLKHQVYSTNADIATRARAYVEFLANLRDFLDGSQAGFGDIDDEGNQINVNGNYYGYGSTTVSDWVMPPDSEFDKAHTFADIPFIEYYYNGVFYAGNERGPTLSEIQVRIEPKWKNIKRDKNGKFIEGDLHVAIKASVELVNFYREYRYKSVTVSLQGIEIFDAMKTLKTFSKTLPENHAFNNASILVPGQPDTVLADFKLGTYTVDPVVPANSTPPEAIAMRWRSIKNLQVRCGWFGVGPDFLVDRAWLLPAEVTQDLVPPISFGKFITDPIDPENSLQDVVFGFEAKDPRCNTITGNWNAYLGAGGSLGQLQPIIGGDVEPGFAAGELSTAFIRNGLPRSLWEFGAVDRAEYGRTLRLSGGSPLAGGSYDGGDWELLDQLTLGCDDPTKGESENGKVNPNSATLGAWDAMLKSTRLILPADNQPATRTTPNPEETDATFIKTYGAENASPAQEIGNLNKVTPAMLDKLICLPLPTRGHLALLSLQAGEPNDRQQEELVGKLANLLQTRYQYFEVISIGRDIQTSGETGTPVIKAEQKIRSVVERDAYKNELRIISQEILPE